MSIITEGMPNISEQRKGRLEAFAPYVAPLPWFTIDILHKLYLNIYVRHNPISDDYRIRAITCSDLIFSPAVTKVSHNVFMYNADVQESLRGIINPQKEVLRDIGIFMLAYLSDCRPHFLGLKYRESFRIEGNLILKPVAEAGRIAGHIINRLNQIRSFDEKRNTVAYYLDILQQPEMVKEQQELIRFLQGYEKFDGKANALPEEWKGLQNKTDENANAGISIKLPFEVRERILAEIQKAAPSKSGVQTLHLICIGIDQYMDSNTYPLDGAVNDANQISHYLESNASDAFEFQSRLILNQQATKAGILSAINDLSQQAVDGDIVFFYFAGYGGNESASGAADEMINQNVMQTPPEDQPILICHDTMPDTNPALGLNEVDFAFSKLPKSCQTVFVFDCGFQREEIKGDYKARSLAGDVNMRRPDQWVLKNDSNLPSEQGWGGYAIFASDEYHNVYETPEGGIFTRSLLEALKENQNSITYEDLIKEVKSAAVVEDMASPRIVPHGNFFMDRPFLFGFLKEGENVEKRIAWATETKAEKLDLSGLRLTSIPGEVFQLTQLKELNLSNNQISEIPAEILSLLNLVELNISQNPIVRIDDAVGNLEQLNFFKAQDCGLKSFPYMLLNCKKMFRIDVAQNKIQWMPIQIKDNDFHPDAQLVLSGNPVLNIPEDLHLSRMDRFKAHFKDWDIRPVGRHGVAVLIGFDFDKNLRYLTEEISFLEKTLKEVGIETVTLFNPSAEDLYRTLYEHQEQMTILHIGAERIDKLKVADETIREINEETIVELFRCIRRHAFPAKLAFFNYCNSDVIISELMPGSFACAIGTEDKIDDEVAFNWSRVFYSRLVKGEQLEESFANSLIEYSGS